MNYELAKQLKEAGFPQNHGKMGEYPMYVAPVDEPGKPTLSRDICRVPTLEELILEVYKYCHEVRLECVKDNPGIWAACTSWGDLEDDWQRGNSPTEALAKLWLTLHTKRA